MFWSHPFFETAQLWHYLFSTAPTFTCKYNTCNKQLFSLHEQTNVQCKVRVDYLHVYEIKKNFDRISYKGPLRWLTATKTDDVFKFQCTQCPLKYCSHHSPANRRQKLVGGLNNVHFRTFIFRAHRCGYVNSSDQWHTIFWKGTQDQQPLEFNFSKYFKSHWVMTQHILTVQYFHRYYLKTFQRNLTLNISSTISIKYLWVWWNFFIENTFFKLVRILFSYFFMLNIPTFESHSLCLVLH